MNCSNCNKELSEDMFNAGMCFNCGHLVQNSIAVFKIEQERDIKGKELLKQIQREKHIAEQIEKRNNHKLTTSYSFEGYSIIKYLGLVSGEIVVGTGYLSDIAASFSDFFGTQSIEYSLKLKETKKAALQDMIKDSISLGGNSIIGISYEYLTFSGNMIGVSVNGTSVLIKSKEE